MINKILLLNLLTLLFLFDNLTAQHDQHDQVEVKEGEHEIFKSDIEGFEISLTSNLYPLVAGKEIVFSVKAVSQDNEKQFNPVFMSLNISGLNKNITDNKLIFTKLRLEDKYVLNYTFWKKGKYNFELEIRNIDSLSQNKTNKFAFTQEVKEIGESKSTDSHNGGMGMGSGMLIVMAGVMVVLMAVIGIGSWGHR